MKTRWSVVGTGLIGLDVIVNQDGQVETSSLGGSAGNVLSILATLGWTSSPITLLGKDAAGNRLVSELESIGANTRYVVQSEAHHTPVIYQHQLGAKDEATHRFSFSCPYCGIKHKPDFHAYELCLSQFLSDLPQADVLFLDRPTTFALKLAEYYFSRGTLVVFEPSAVGESTDLFQQILNCTHILKYADERFPHLNAFNLNKVEVEIQTMGSKGLRFRAPSLTHDWCKLGAYDLPVIRDTSGAGDWCTAGFIYSLFGKKKSKHNLDSYNHIAQSLAFGQVLSSFNCLTYGARGLFSQLPVKTLTKAASSLSKSRFSTNVRSVTSLEACPEDHQIYHYFYQESSKLSAKPALKPATFSEVCCI